MKKKWEKTTLLTERVSRWSLEIIEAYRHITITKSNVIGNDVQNEWSHQVRKFRKVLMVPKLWLNNNNNNDGDGDDDNNTKKEQKRIGR